MFELHALSCLIPSDRQTDRRTGILTDGTDLQTSVEDMKKIHCRLWHLVVLRGVHEVKSFSYSAGNHLFQFNTIISLPPPTNSLTDRYVKYVQLNSWMDGWIDSCISQQKKIYSICYSYHFYYFFQKGQGKELQGRKSLKMRNFSQLQVSVIYTFYWLY